MKIGIATELPPIDEFVVKVASRCNIDCDYCYEFNHGDESWRRLPPLMSPATAELVARRIVEHSTTHLLSEVAVSFHGGEPLVLGSTRLDQLLNIFGGIFNAAGLRVRLAVQTNGILLTDSVVATLKHHQVSVGISLDGGLKHNDLHRLSKLGKSTFVRSAEGIRRLVAAAPELFAGVLAVIDLNNDPIEVVDELYSLGTRNIDLLLPHHNWRAPPPRSAPTEVDYANWYLRVWNEWTGGRWPELRIRFLENLVRRLAGHPGIYEQMSLSPANLITINTDGGLEHVDTLKSTGAGSQATGLHLSSNTFDDVMKTAEYVSRCFPAKTLCATCQACNFADICVGGYHPHRFDVETGFNNPSVYCQDLKALIRSVEAAITL